MLRARVVDWVETAILMEAAQELARLASQHREQTSRHDSTVSLQTQSINDVVCSRIEGGVEPAIRTDSRHEVSFLSSQPAEGAAQDNIAVRLKRRAHHRVARCGG